MKIFKIAIWTTVLFYISQICFSVWYLYTFVSSPKFPEIPILIRYGFPIFIILINCFPVVSIIGLIRKKNWGRILAIIIYIFLSLSLIYSRIVENIILRDANILNALVNHKAIWAYIYLIPLIALALFFMQKKTKDYFTLDINK